MSRPATSLLQDSSGCYVRSEGPLTAVVGLKDAVVVVTHDAVLAMHRDRADEVREVVRSRKRYGRSEASGHSRSHHLWGSCESLTRQERYEVKRVVVRPGGTLGPRRHLHRSEHWIVLSGAGFVWRQGERLRAAENKSFHTLSVATTGSRIRSASGWC